MTAAPAPTPEPDTTEPDTHAPDTHTRDTPGDDRRHRRIVVGVDGSPEACAALEWAVREAERTGGDVDAVLAYDSGLAWIDVGSDYQTAIVQHSAEHAWGELHRALTEANPDGKWPVPVHPLAVAGAPAEVLVDFGRKADLLVVGSRGRGAFAGLLLGSVSQRCAERSTCPVVVVPGPRADAELEGAS
jgi:nucleotide-binding universal stress UspA family protein